MSKKPKDIVIKVRKNKRCKAGLQILDFSRFNTSFLLLGVPGSRALFTSEDGEILKIFVKVVDNDVSNNPYRCSSCVFGNRIAKRNHCTYLNCWHGQWVVDLNDVMEEV